MTASAVDVANMSFGSKGGVRGIMSEWLLNRGAMKKIISSLPDVTFVAAGGNDPINAEEIFPAKYSLSLDNFVTVGGADVHYNQRWDDSVYGEAVTIAAPGQLVWTVDTSEPRGYDHWNGTSFAAPMVSGTVALLKAIDPDLEPREIKDLLRETGDEKTICTSTSDPCPSGDEEDWKFLRADKAVAKVLSDQIEAVVGDRVTVPGDTQRVIGSNYDYGVDIVNRGEMVWPFYVEAFLRDPKGVESEVPYVAENAIAPGRSHPFRWRFWPSANASGCWDLRVKVWMEDPGGDQTHLIDTLKELNPAAQDHGLLADSGWMNEALEVRRLSDQPLSCSGADKMVPLPLPSAGEEDDPLSMVPQTGVKSNILLLADTSGSMEGQKVAALREAIEIFANRMYEIRFQTKGGIDPDPDHVGLVGFDNYYYEVLPIGPVDPAGAGLDAWEDAANSLGADGGTALYDSIIQAVDVLEDQTGPARSKVLIALTDGVDQDSGNSFSDALERLSESSVTLFALALSEPGGGGGDYEFDVLEELANASGGAAYVADTNNLSGLYELFSTIFEIEP